MSNIVEAICSKGPVSFPFATASDTFNRALELEQRPHGSSRSEIAVSDRAEGKTK